MLNDYVKIIPTTPENALLKWQIVVLRAVRHKYSVDKNVGVEFLFMEEKVFDEMGIDPIGRKAQMEAIQSLRHDLMATPIYEAAYLSDGTEYYATRKPPIGYTVTIFDIKEIDELIRQKVANLRSISIIRIRFNITTDTSSISVNGMEINYNLGTWKGCIVKVLAEGKGEATANDITNERNAGLKKTANKMITNYVGQINSDIAKNTGIRNLLFGQDVVKFNKEFYLIEID